MIWYCLSTPTSQILFQAVWNSKGLSVAPMVTAKQWKAAYIPRPILAGYRIYKAKALSVTVSHMTASYGPYRTLPFDACS